MKPIFKLALFLIICFSFQYANGQDKIFVNPSASGKADGTSWKDAYTSIEKGIDNSSPGDTIWIKAGQYTPKDSTQTSTFAIPNNRHLFGGFSGTETLLSQRDLDKNKTIIDGNIGNQAKSSDNIRVLFTYRDARTAGTVDGFTFQKGYMYTPDEKSTDGGGAIRAINSKVNIYNCQFIDNYSYIRGGAIYADTNTIIYIYNSLFLRNKTGITNSSAGGAIYYSNSFVNVEDSRFSMGESKNGGAITASASSLTVKRCVFDGNKANNGFGGAINNSLRTTNIYSSLFVGNYSHNRGSAVYVGNASASRGIRNCTFSGNYVHLSNGDSYSTVAASSKYAIFNSIFWGNHADVDIQYGNVQNCIIKGGKKGGIHVLDTNPQFISHGDSSKAPFSLGTYNYGLKKNSPAIGIGVNKFATDEKMNFDVVGAKRIQGDTIDLGALESPYSLFSITAKTNNGIAGKVSGGGKFVEKDEVNLVATVLDTCYQFLHWKEKDTIYSKEKSIKLTANSSREFTAVFEELNIEVITKAEPFEGGGTGGDGTYKCATAGNISLTATASPCYEFVKWTYKNVTMSTNPNFNFSTRENVTMIAHFKKSTPKLTINIEPVGAGLASGSGDYTCDTEAKVQAKSNSGYRFLQWKEGQTTLSFDSTYAFNIKKNRTLTAEFEKIPSSIKIHNQLVGKIYPNPSKGILEIELDQTYSMVEIKITNALGQKIATHQHLGANKFTVDIQGPSGLYFIELIADNNKSQVIKIQKR